MTDSEKIIAKLTLKILQKKSWGAISLDDIISKKSKKNIYFKSKNDLLKNINRYVDDILIEKTKSLEISSTKDMLFEVLMARFDILQENRLSFDRIYKGLKKSPDQLISLFPSFLESMIVTAELAKLNVNGIKGSIRLKILMFLYFVTFNQWLDDKTPSLEKTMMQLDKNLDRAEKLEKIFS